MPLPEYVIALADAQAAAGRADEAAQSVELARAEIQLFEATGVMVDLDLALFEADHGDPDRALAFAESAYAATRTSAPQMRARGRCIGSGATVKRDVVRRGASARVSRPIASLPRRRDRGCARG